MPDLLANGRVNAEKGQRLRLRVLVSTARVLVDVGGGLPSIQHVIEDSGFSEVAVFADQPPASWLPRAKVTPATFPDWLLWVEAVPTEDASIRADFVPSALITDAWTAVEPTAPVKPAKIPDSPANPSQVPASSGSLSVVLGVGLGALGILGVLAWAVSRATFDDEIDQ